MDEMRLTCPTHGSRYMRNLRCARCIEEAFMFNTTPPELVTIEEETCGRHGLPVDPVVGGCSRCIIEALPCSFDPTPLLGVPIGMFHCPECGEMVLAGFPHPPPEAEQPFPVEPDPECGECRGTGFVPDGRNIMRPDGTIDDPVEQRICDCSVRYPEGGTQVVKIVPLSALPNATANPSGAVDLETVSAGWRSDLTAQSPVMRWLCRMEHRFNHPEGKPYAGYPDSGWAPRCEWICRVMDWLTGFYCHD